MRTVKQLLVFGLMALNGLSYAQTYVQGNAFFNTYTLGNQSVIVDSSNNIFLSDSP